MQIRKNRAFSVSGFAAHGLAVLSSNRGSDFSKLPSPVGSRQAAEKRTGWGLTLLLLTFLAPACAPNEPPPPPAIPRNLVLLTDTTQWNSSALIAYKDSLAGAGYRVVVSGFPGETPAELTVRLPWLLQPGVDLFLYDENLAGVPGRDSLLNYLELQGHPAKVRSVRKR